MRLDINHVSAGCIRQVQRCNRHNPAVLFFPFPEAINAIVRPIAKSNLVQYSKMKRVVLYGLPTQHRTQNALVMPRPLQVARQAKLVKVRFHNACHAPETHTTSEPTTPFSSPSHSKINTQSHHRPPGLSPCPHSPAADTFPPPVDYYSPYRASYHLSP